MATRIIRPAAIAASPIPDLDVAKETQGWVSTQSLTIYSYKVNRQSFGQLLQRLPELKHLRLVDVVIDSEEGGDALPISKWLGHLELVRTTPSKIMLRAMSAVVNLAIRSTDPDFPAAPATATGGPSLWRFNRPLFETMVQYMAALKTVTVDGFVLDTNHRPNPNCVNRNVKTVVNKTGVDVAGYFPMAVIETA